MNISKEERERLVELLSRLGESSAYAAMWAQSHLAMKVEIWSDQDRKDYQAIRDIILNTGSPNPPRAARPSVTMGEIWEACRSENGMINLKDADRVADLLRSRGVEVAE